MFNGSSVLAVGRWQFRKKKNTFSHLIKSRSASSLNTFWWTVQHFFFPYPSIQKPVSTQLTCYLICFKKIKQQEKPYLISVDLQRSVSFAEFWQFCCRLMFIPSWISFLPSEENIPFWDCQHQLRSSRREGTRVPTVCSVPKREVSECDLSSPRTVCYCLDL